MGNQHQKGSLFLSLTMSGHLKLLCLNSWTEIIECSATCLCMALLPQMSSVEVTESVPSACLSVLTEGVSVLTEGVLCTSSTVLEPCDITRSLCVCKESGVITSVSLTSALHHFL